MSTTRTQLRIAAGSLAAVGAIVVLALASGPVHAGPVDSTTTTTPEPTSTVTSTTAPPETTTTTAAPPPTTRPPVTTTTTVRRSSTTTAPPVSSTVEPTTTAPSTTASTAPQFIIPDDTIPPREEAESSSDAGLSTDVELGLVVGGLMAVGALIGFLTVLYWRHTRPQPYLAALDVLSDVSVAAASDAPTGRLQGIGPLPMTGAASAAPAAATTTTTNGAIFPDEPASTEANTQSVRIVGPLALFGGDAPADASGAGDAVEDAPEPVGVPDTLDADDPHAPYPPLVTIEDLFGPSPEETPSPGS